MTIVAAALAELATAANHAEANRHARSLEREIFLIIAQAPPFCSDLSAMLIVCFQEKRAPPPGYLRMPARCCRRHSSLQSSHPENVPEDPSRSIRRHAAPPPSLQ